MFTPKTEMEVADVIRSANNGLHVQGGGTRSIGVTNAQDVLSMRALSGIELYEPGALTLVAKAGTPISEINATLDEQGQMLAFEPIDHRLMLGTRGDPTIGGAVAGNVSGPRRIAAGACRDFLLGVRFVDGQGRALQNGGRVMKNVTGYDLVKLMAGSYGTLGAITEVSLKVLPKPETEVTIFLTDVDPDQAVRVMSKAMNTPFDISGAFYGPFDRNETTKLCLRIEGRAISVKYRMDELMKLLSADGTPQVEADRDASQAIWADIRDMKMVSDAPFVARSSIRPSQATEFIQTQTRVCSATNYLDWAGGLVWTAASENDLAQNANTAKDNAEALVSGAKRLIDAMREAMSQYDGHTTLIKSPKDVRQTVQTFHPENDVVRSLAQNVRAEFDPRGILNPGLMD